MFSYAVVVLSATRTTFFHAAAKMIGNRMTNGADDCTFVIKAMVEVRTSDLPRERLVAAAHHRLCFTVFNMS